MINLEVTDLPDASRHQQVDEEQVERMANQDDTIDIFLLEERDAFVEYCLGLNVMRFFVSELAH